MVDHNLIVPYRIFSLKECVEIIQQALGKPNTPPPQLKLPAEVWQGWIDACLTEAKTELNQYELDFLFSVNDQLARKGKLNEKQTKKLEQIYTERV